MTALEILPYLQRLFIEQDLEARALHILVGRRMAHAIELVLGVRTLLEHHIALIEQILIALIDEK